MGSQFEQTTLILYDSIILALMEQLGEKAADMKLRHANLE